MSRYLFTALPSNDFGLLTRSLPIARELKLVGHEVAFCHPARGPQILIREAGFENLLHDDPLYHLPNENLYRLLKRGKALRTLKVLAGMIGGMRNMRRLMADIRNADDFNALILNNTELTCANVDALADIIKSFRADAVVDFWNPWACIAAKSLKKPLITVISSFQHPQSPGIIWWKDIPSSIPSPVPFTNEILDQYGLPAIHSTCDLFLGDLTLVLGAPELDPLPDSARVTYIGSVLWQNPEMPIPEWMGELKADRPVVWIYPGKLQYKSADRQGRVLLRAAIQVLAKEDVQVVLTTGYNDLPRSFLPLPPNFRLEPFVPGLAMAERSDLMIHHGGYGSCQTGLSTGTPAVIIPTFSERECNARRVIEQGAGEMVLPAYEKSGKRMRIDAAELTDKVRKVLSAASYKENAQRISTRLKEYGGAPKAARLIEKVNDRS